MHHSCAPLFPAHSWIIIIKYINIYYVHFSITGCLNIFFSFHLWQYGNISGILMIYVCYQHIQLEASHRNGCVLDGKGKIIYSPFCQQEAVRKKQWLVLRRAGRKCFLFQSVLYPLVINKGTIKRE